MSFVWSETLKNSSFIKNYLLAPHVWFKTGGMAEIFFKPKDEEDLILFLKTYPKDLPLTVLGAGSNILIRDGGIRGVVTRLMGPFSSIKVDGNFLHSGSGALDHTIALTAHAHGLSGLEFFIGIPGTLGGAVYMNAGAYHQETFDTLVSVKIATREGHIQTFKKADIPFGYRFARFPSGSIILEAIFQLQPGNPDVIQNKMASIIESRKDSQPIYAKTGGSTFKNPPGPLKAWELIDQAGFRGATKGGAEISSKHCNFLINKGSATTSDLEALAQEAWEAVYNKTGIPLEWEIKRLGDEKKTWVS